MQDPYPVDLAIFNESADAVGKAAMLGLFSNMIYQCISDLDALHNAGYEDFRSVCHRIAGAAAPCGAARLSALASTKERGPDFTEGDLAELREAVLQAKEWLEQEAAGNS